jgi:hypothetical protein
MPKARRSRFVLDVLGRACYLPAKSLDVADSKILQELDSVPAAKGIGLFCPFCGMIYAGIKNR